MQEPPVQGVSCRTIETNRIRMRLWEMGETGPVVLLVHGWPESWYSWRHQISAIAESGYRVVIPEMRGYGKTEAPDEVESYDIVNLAADMTGVLDTLGVEKANIIGHDWGAIVAANTVLLHPNRFSSLVLMSVPYTGRPDQSPLESMKAKFGDNFFYILYHNKAGGIAEAEYDADPRGILSRLYLSPNSPRKPRMLTHQHHTAGGWIPRLGAAKDLPEWLNDDELDYYVAQFTESGFRGGINYYRNIDRNWRITEHIKNSKIEIPTLFIAGAKDVVIGGLSDVELTEMMIGTIPRLTRVVILPEMGHWIQQEAPTETNAAVVEFLTALQSP